MLHLDFARAFELFVVNLCFPKRENHLVTFHNTVAMAQIDYALLPKGDISLFMDCKRDNRKKTLFNRLRFRYGSLTPTLYQEKRDKLIGLGPWSSSENVNNKWNMTASCI